MSNFEIIQIPALDVRFNPELEGVIPKGWIDKSPRGRVLFKEATSDPSQLAESRTDWTEKVVDELNQLISLPAS